MVKKSKTFTMTKSDEFWKKYNQNLTKSEQFWKKYNRAIEMNKAIEQITRQNFGTKSTFEGLTVLEARNVIEAYIEAGGSVD